MKGTGLEHNALDLGTLLQLRHPLLRKSQHDAINSGTGFWWFRDLSFGSLGTEGWWIRDQGY